MTPRATLFHRSWSRWLVQHGACPWHARPGFTTPSNVYKALSFRAATAGLSSSFRTDALSQHGRHIRPTTSRLTPRRGRQNSWTIILTDCAREANVAPIPFITELASVRDRLFVLLLERVGGELERFPTLKDDLWNAYRVLAHMSINMARDVKYNNILMAPNSPPGLPSLPSPFTQRTHNIRIIDLELALKTIFTDDIIMSSCKGYFSRVIHSC
ncbi:hypothetical protein EXIGLDRAFT_839518 [Exidia glandulosa HHB12029]|uniref:Uncharacterized protein n=1 Tax=Exidia glandulosa HHB12029 TaxID=1314781 RepID=A0A165F0H9_EXIGL|nr:hypothetical protein EXIGLDRAFT_839518 [Exidia glandulosa HHB12029]